ncbi:biotin--[acetyl-CoA-carboxylase] ligase [Polynucleobacter necessarius]|uniref:biotin--[acetyl-CoA-carboxylase] ligase n=1 Tax=Polynucleobacter necessarius TaxID=576610 RepID=UPI000E092E95|nr:biotin--[acetyl-CoA-carboxylase] ligase [Polynucleobacter necessarius]HAT39553.1 biotin--[acetyl-CoA-carboxylase] ligase [Polynucleobacter sp.]
MTANCIFERVAETRSTNDDLLERWRAGELIDPVARIAYRQTAGKGRAGRSWLASPEDSLCFSLAHPFKRTPAELSGLSLLVGLAVLSGIAQACNLRGSELHEAGFRLKWPNDLLLNNNKLAGILIEGGQAKAGELTWMIIGVGINLRNAGVSAAQLTNELKASSLDQITKSPIDNEYLWLKLVESLENHFAKFDQYGFRPYKEEWMQWDAYLGQTACISGAGKDPVFGIARGVDDSGALLLQQANKTVTVHAGDVSLRIQA